MYNSIPWHYVVSLMNHVFFLTVYHHVRHVLPNDAPPLCWCCCLLSSSLHAPLPSTSRSTSVDVRHVAHHQASFILIVARPPHHSSTVYVRQHPLRQASGFHHLRLRTSRSTSVSFIYVDLRLRPSHGQRWTTTMMRDLTININ